MPLHYKFKLTEALTGRAIETTGGTVYVAVRGGARKVAITNEDGSAKLNPLVPVNGQIEFYTAESIPSVDLYCQTPGGHFIVRKAITPGGDNELIFDGFRSAAIMVIPFSAADAAAGVEVDTGFDLPTNALVQPFDGLAVDVLTVNAGRTIQAGILSTEAGGNAAGFVNGVSLAALGAVPGNNTIITGSNETYVSATNIGTLLQAFVAGSDVNGDAGNTIVKQFRCDGVAKSISFTLSAGTTLAEGFLKVPYVLPSV